ncbi:Peptidyl-tRNA hydrolase [Hondaea fermentalgiana]|uniref:peptidyl-tRNA hydrolase n=1 Tax=Hondaea fermentalgiana TaxID=2315210 RepID=A0A2R5G380_9STRA|nr:Peptidyl-tRNA hydrolase [Hondaea fermentalgiana]|eukprot:GBG24779.1 Peptidyl-tRNA hydrolase [Hondaea fermentalgiana]
MSGTWVAAKALALGLRAALRRWAAELLPLPLATTARGAVRDGRDAGAGEDADADADAALGAAGTMKKRLVVVGLGNFGSEWTRHSVGTQVVRRLAERRGVAWAARRDCAANVASDEDLILVEPRLFMNENGKAAAAVLRQFLRAKKPRDASANLVVVHDDLDRPFANFRWKQRGSASGHNGVRSVIEHLGSDDFRRVQVGIGRPSARGAAVSAHVLGSFSRDEIEAIKDRDGFLSRVCDEIERAASA